jgi:hypothetical protein
MNSRTTSSHIFVPHRFLIKNMESAFEAFRREVYVTRLAQRGCGNPEHLLLLNPWNNECWDLVVELNHDGFFARGARRVCLVNVLVNVF